MTIHRVLAVRDSKTAGFLSPFCAPTLGAAERSLSDVVNGDKQNNSVAAHPEDFELFELGTFDDATGLFATGVPRSVCLCESLVRG